MSKKFLNKSNFSKIIMSVSMMGFFGIASPNTASADCSQYHDNEEDCNNQPNCKFLPAGTNCRAALGTQNTYSNFICAMNTTEAPCNGSPEGCHWGQNASFCLPVIGKETKK